MKLTTAQTAPPEIPSVTVIHPTTAAAPAFLATFLTDHLKILAANANCPYTSATVNVIALAAQIPIISALSTFESAPHST